jgi:predicted nucleic acid-binding Zn ribbon protein
MQTLTCPHCHTQVPNTAGVCAGCGAEIVRGLTRRQRTLVGLLFVAIALVVFGLVVNAYQIAYGHTFLRSLKAEDGLLAIAGLTCVVFLPYLLGISVARLVWRSRIRFYRSYQHR